ncbi:hypothetical protein PR202_gb29824 [Eleusine coracana subsp. coracana]|uniref:PCI domain-containing protein n=1 Tax=Eleusine coracana subsp. coracana TaxID=191504 RepID=A0AAV5FXZ9_ELECO|nr:hypothetical protein PR202_gb29824 [Eleusine coracana subsp. coracana]
MGQDVVMDDSQTQPEPASAAIASPDALTPAQSTLQHLKEIASVIEAGSLNKEVRRISRAIRLTVALRRRLAARDVSAFLAFALPPSSDAFARLSVLVPKEDGSEMDVDTAATAVQVSIKHGLPEIEIYCYLLVLIFLIDNKKYDEAKACASASILRLKNLNRRTVDVLACRLYSYFSYVHELTNTLAEIRGTLLALHRMATLHRDELGQETLLNLLLRNYLHYNLYDQAEKLRSKAPCFEAHSSQQAVRVGDLELFRAVADKFSSTFSADRTRNLIVRLRHNVIRTGLRNISISYSRISLVDIAKKLRLESPNSVADAESIVAKAIRDGAIDATIDHANGWMVSKETGDVYSTNEPQIAFNSRIAFCLNMHNEAVKALRFPPNSHKEKESAEKRRERLQQEEELAKHMAEEDDDDF